MNIYTKIVTNLNYDEAKKIFGINNEKEINILKENANFKGKIYLQEAVLRYNGIAFKNLDYNTLDKEAKNYIKENVLIFSNLFSAIKAGDYIPYYKLKQGKKLGDIDTSKFYKPIFKETIDKYLKNEFIVDLRAKFYEKFYQIPYPYITFNFYKNGKKLSHYAKAHRGKILRILAINRPLNQDELKNIEFENLTLIDIKKIKLKTEYNFEI